MTKKRYVKPCLSLVALAVVCSLLFVASVPQRAATQAPTTQLIESNETIVGQEGTWTAQDTPNASGGSYLYSSGSTDDVLTLHFEGTSVEIVYIQHPSFGVMAIEIDGTVVRTVDTYAENAVFDVSATVDYLEDKSHMLRIYPASGTIAIDAFETIPGMFLLWHDEFNDVNGWFFNPGDFAAQPDSSIQALQLGNGVYGAYFRLWGLENPEVQARFSIQSGALRFSTRYSEAGRYSVVINPTGQVELYRDETLLASTMTDEIGIDQWHTLRFLIVDGHLTLRLDFDEVLSVSDAMPLPPGTIAFELENEIGEFLVDELHIWVPNQERPPIADELPTASTFSQRSLSSGGGKIVFAYAASAQHQSNSGLFMVDADIPGIPIKVENTNSRDGYLNAGVDITADGTRVVFSAQRDDWYDLYIINVDGTGLRRLTQDNNYNVEPAWSPDGSKIAFSSRVNEYMGIYVIDLTTCLSGICPKTLVIEPENPVPLIAYGKPTWSPSGTEIAFTSQDINGNGGLHIVSVDGSNERQITYSTYPAYYSDPAWSPTDSKYTGGDLCAIGSTRLI